MRRRAGLVLSGAMLFVMAALGNSRVEAQSRCADCHFANPGSTPGNHLSEYDLSAHGRAQIGCERCHGGDPTTFEPSLAHREILNSRNPASPLRRENLPRTCGTCHTGPFVAFQKSRHYELLRSGSQDAPVCTTCHGEVASNLLSPRGLQSQCASCHGEGKRAPRTDYPPEGRMMLEGIRDARALLKEARNFIGRVKDPARRTALEQAAQQAEVPLVEATNAGHAFVYDDLEERLSVARQRIADLFERLANPQSR